MAQYTMTIDGRPASTVFRTRAQVIKKGTGLTP
jgi:hypothetical protein